MAGSTRWPQVGLDQPPACPPHLGSWPPLDGIPWVSRDGPGPWHDHCWDEAGTLAGWEGVNLERNGPTGTAMPGTPTQQKRGVGTHVAACDSCITELCAQNVWFLDKAMLFNQPRLEIGRLSQGEASPAPLRSGVSSGPPEAPGWGVGAPGGAEGADESRDGCSRRPPHTGPPRIQMKDVVTMARIVPVGMDFCASLRSPDRFEPAMMPVEAEGGDGPRTHLGDAARPALSGRVRGGWGWEAVPHNARERPRAARSRCPHAGPHRPGWASLHTAGLQGTWWAARVPHTVSSTAAQP